VGEIVDSKCALRWSRSEIDTEISSLSRTVGTMQAAQRRKRVQEALSWTTLVTDVISLIQDYAQQVQVLCLGAGVAVYNPETRHSTELTSFWLSDPSDERTMVRGPCHVQAHTATLWRGAVHLADNMRFDLHTAMWSEWGGLSERVQMYYASARESQQLVTVATGPSPGIYLVCSAGERTVAWYNDKRSAWTLQPAFVHNRSQPAVLAYGTSIYLVGGGSPYIEKYDTAQPALGWLPVANILHNHGVRFQVAVTKAMHAAILDDMLYVPSKYGELVFTDMRQLSDASVWHNTPDQHHAVGQLSAVLAVDGRLLLITPGHSESCVYNPKRGRWRSDKLVPPSWADAPSSCALALVC
jgi:hypothetical protein